MTRKKPPTITTDGEVQWNDDDFNLDSFGVEAPTEGLEGLRQVGSLDVVDLPAPDRPFGAYAGELR